MSKGKQRRERVKASVRAARIIYDLHKLESMTMPALGLPVEQYVLDLARIIDQEMLKASQLEHRSRLAEVEAQRDELVKEAAWILLDMSDIVNRKTASSVIVPCLKRHLPSLQAAIAKCEVKK